MKEKRILRLLKEKNQAYKVTNVPEGSKVFPKPVDRIPGAEPPITKTPSVT